jgi:hypothetical protein
VTDADVAGVPTPFQFAGQTYQVHPRTLHIELLFQTWAEQQALRAIQRHRSNLGEQDYQVAIDGWRRDVGACLYAFGQNLCHRALLSPAGMRYMIFLKLARGAKDGGPPVDQQLVDRMAQDRGKWDEVVEIMMQQDFPQAEDKEGQDPNQEPEGPRATT